MLKSKIEINAINACAQEKTDEEINAVGMLKNATICVDGIPGEIFKYASGLFLL